MTKISIIGMTDKERDEVFQEIESNGFTWDWGLGGGIFVEGSKYGIEGFCMWLDSLDILWGNGD